MSSSKRRLLQAAAEEEEEEPASKIITAKDDDDDEPIKNDSSGCSKPQTTIRLLLHAVDGVVPYLTPALLRRCFPAAKFQDVLWMGMAVRDTCVVPVFDDKKKKKTKKARGYTFSSTTKVDAWMQAYPRVTVPTFCLVEDNVAAHFNTKNPTTDVVVADKHVLLWTPNGRLPLTPDLYIAAANGLNSQVVVSLFDTIPPPLCGSTTETKMDEMDKSTRSKMLKREQAAIRRTLDWNQQHVAALTTTTSSTRTSTTSSRIIWSPLVLDEHQTNETLDAQMDAVLQNNNKSIPCDDADKHNKESSRPKTGGGVALIGWSHLTSHTQSTVMNRLLLVEKGSGSVGNVAVLSTQSLKQILQAARLGVNVIGSNLPTVWARNKMAFIVDIFAWKNRDKTTEPVAKRPRVENDDNEDPENKSTSSTPKLNHDGCLELAPTSNNVNDITKQQHAWFRDARPMLPGCMCHACTTHSRGYIYHLVCAKELLAEMLLFIHNLHHLLALMRLLNNHFTKKEEQKSSNSDEEQQQRRLLDTLIQHVESQLGDGGTR